MADITFHKKKKKNENLKNYVEKLRYSCHIFCNIKLKIYFLYTTGFYNKYFYRMRVSFNFPLTLKILRVF